MSKQDKDHTEIGGSADFATDSMLAEGSTAQLLPASTAEPEQEIGQSEQSRLFNSWLDRTLPRLMEYLAATPSSAVTLPRAKAKH